MPQLRRGIATATDARPQVGLTPPAAERGPLSAFGDLAAERAIFLFKTGDIARDQKRRLINPVVAGDPASESTKLAVQFRHIGRRHLCNLGKAGDTKRFKQRVQFGTNALE